MNDRICKECKVLKPRIPNGKFNDKDIKFIDGTGKLWNGNLCPDCHRNRVKVKIREIRKLG